MNVTLRPIFLNKLNLFEQTLYFLQKKMDEPTAFGLYHLLWISLAFGMIWILCKNKIEFNERKLKITLGTYGIIALILEIGKQLIWAFNYDPLTNIVSWKYEWYAFPFQLCSTPMYVSIFCLFLKKCQLRNWLLSYIAYITILGSCATILVPSNCFSSYMLVNFHTMWLHVGSFVLSIYLLISNEVKAELKYLIKSYYVFILFTTTALLLNISIYKIGILNGQKFNMFYISPYFISELPVFSLLQKQLPYVFFLLSYVFALLIGGFLVYKITKLLK